MVEQLHAISELELGQSDDQLSQEQREALDTVVERLRLYKENAKKLGIAQMHFICGPTSDRLIILGVFGANVGTGKQEKAYEEGWYGIEMGLAVAMQRYFNLTADERDIVQVRAVTFPHSQLQTALDAIGCTRRNV